MGFTANRAKHLQSHAYSDRAPYPTQHHNTTQHNTSRHNNNIEYTSKHDADNIPIQCQRTISMQIVYENVKQIWRLLSIYHELCIRNASEFRLSDRQVSVSKHKERTEIQVSSPPSACHLARVNANAANTSTTTCTPLHGTWQLLHTGNSPAAILAALAKFPVSMQAISSFLSSTVFLRTRAGFPFPHFGRLRTELLTTRQKV